MPIFFLLIGILLVIVAINDKLSTLTGLLKDDFIPSSSQPGFAVWILAIFAIGAIGYVKELKPFSNAFLVLVVIGILLSNKGFFAQFETSIEGIGK